MPSFRIEPVPFENLGDTLLVDEDDPSKRTAGREIRHVLAVDGDAVEFRQRE